VTHDPIGTHRECELRDRKTKGNAPRTTRNIMPEMIGFPRGEWLERKIGKVMDYMGFAMPFTKPYIEEFWRVFLTKAHLQGRLVGMRDRDKVRHFCTMLLYHTRYIRDSKCERRLRAVTAKMVTECMFHTCS
jgi:hypothetical protein